MLAWLADVGGDQHIPAVTLEVVDLVGTALADWVGKQHFVDFTLDRHAISFLSETGSELLIA